MHDLDSSADSTATNAADGCPAFESGPRGRYKAPRQHVRRAARTLRLSLERSANELSDGFKRAASELRLAAKSAREVWRESR